MLSPFLLTYGLFLVSASPLAILPTRRQVVEPVPSSSPTSSDGGGQPVPMAAVIAISVVLGTGVVILLLVQIRQWRKRRQGRDNRPVQEDTTLQSLTAEDLAGTRPTNGTDPNSTPAVPRGRRSRRRGVRRTESGRSVKTLPEYSKEAGDEELVLVRRRSGSMSDEEYEPGDDQPEMAGTASVPITIRSASHSRSRSPPSITIRNEGDDLPQPIRPAHLPESSSSSMMETLHDRGWGEAPTYLEAMSALDPDAPPRPSPIPAPRQGAIQRTASGFRDLLTRPFAPGAFRSPQPVSGQSTPASGVRSRAGSTSALLHPITSRFSTATSAEADYPSPWASTHSLLISPPVPHTAIRASFDGSSIPKGGLTKEQMRFLSSNEAVNLVGIRLEDVTPVKRRRRSDLSGQGTPGSPRRASEDIEEDGGPPPPSWEQLDGERRRSEAYDRRNLAQPVEIVDRYGLDGSEAVDVTEEQTESSLKVQNGESSAAITGGAKETLQPDVTNNTPRHGEEINHEDTNSST